MVLGVRIYKHSNCLLFLCSLENVFVYAYFEWYIRTCSGKFVTDHRPILSGQGLSKTSFFRVSKLGKKGCFLGGGGCPQKSCTTPRGGGGHLEKCQKMAFFRVFLGKKEGLLSSVGQKVGKLCSGLQSKTDRNEIGKNSTFSESCQKVRRGCCTFGVFFALQPVSPF